jgi:hypothetical protein
LKRNAKAGRALRKTERGVGLKSDFRIFGWAEDEAKEDGENFLKKVSREAAKPRRKNEARIAEGGVLAALNSVIKTI